MHCQSKDLKQITLTQDRYVRDLKPIALTREQRKMPEQGCSDTLNAAYMTLLGGVGLTLNTRHDVAVYCGPLLRAQQTPHVKHVIMLNRVVKWIRRKSCVITFVILIPPLKVLVVSDSAFKRQDESPVACRGSMLVLGTDSGENPGGDLHVIDYQSKKQKRVTRSTYGAELHGLADTMEGARRIACAFTELYKGVMNFDDICRMEDQGAYHHPLDACLDAKSVFDSIVAADLKAPAEASLMPILGQMREHLHYKRIRYLFWIDTRDMLADGMTKEPETEEWRYYCLMGAKMLSGAAATFTLAAFMQ